MARPVVYHGGAYYGNNAWHGGYYGSSASAYGATAPRTPAPATTRPPELTHAVVQSQTGTAAKAPVKRTTPKPGRTGNGARFQCQRELGKLDGFEKRHHCVQPASNDLSRNHGRCKLERRLGLWRVRQVQQRRRGRNRKRKQVCDGDGNTSGTPAAVGQKTEVRNVSYEQIHFEGLGRPGKERRLIGFQQRRQRLEFEVCKRSWFVEQGSGGGWGGRR